MSQTIASTAPDELFAVRSRNVLITGASGALGSSAALALARRGAKLLLAGTSSSLNEVAERCREAGATVEVAATRIESEADAESLLEAGVAAFGHIDSAILSAGMNDVDPIATLSVERWQRVMDANVQGSWLVCRALGKRLLERGEKGKVILVSSTRGKLGHPAGYTAYCTSKAAIDGLTRALACEWGSRGINVNAIAPTVFRSDLTSWMFADEERGKATRTAMLSRIPLGRLGEPDDLVGAIVFLLSPASDFMTGQTLYVDGGYTAG
jgi:NAD(P)-dependent dehydrogenase (short-subunit alcohol dehydrogenase family)